MPDRATAPENKKLGVATPSSLFYADIMEAAPGLEPGNNGFADRCLSHLAMPPEYLWSGRTDLNRRRPPWQGGTLPLSYARLALRGADYRANTIILSIK